MTTLGVREIYQHSPDNLNNKDTKALIFILCLGVFVVNYLDKLASIN